MKKTLTLSLCYIAINLIAASFTFHVYGQSRYSSSKDNSSTLFYVGYGAPIQSTGFYNYTINDSYAGSNLGATLLLNMEDDNFTDNPIYIGFGAKLFADYDNNRRNTVGFSVPVNVEIGIGNKTVPISVDAGLAVKFGKKINVEPYAMIGAYYIFNSGFGNVEIGGVPPFIDNNGNTISAGDKVGFTIFGMSYKFGASLRLSLPGITPFVGAGIQGNIFSNTSVSNKTTGKEFNITWLQNKPDLDFGGAYFRVGIELPFSLL